MAIQLACLQSEQVNTLSNKLLHYINCFSADNVIYSTAVGNYLSKLQLCNQEYVMNYFLIT